MSARLSLKQRPMLVGILVMAVFAASLGLAFVAARGLPGQKRTLVTADFADVGALRAGDDVRQASLRIGMVGSVEYVDGRARVVLRLDGDRSVYRDARATVWSRSALGQKFVELDPGTESAGELDEDEAIPPSRTGPPQELDTLFNSLDPETRKRLSSTLRATGGGAAGHAPDLRDFLSTSPDLFGDLGTVSRAVNDDEAELVAMLRQTKTLSGRFAGRQQELTQLIDNLGTTLEAVDVDDGRPLAETIEVAPDALARTQAGLDSLHGPLLRTQSAMRRLRPGAYALAKATPDLRATMRQAIDPLEKAPGVAELAEPSMADLTGVAADARPLAPKLGQTLADARPLLRTLAPYGPEITMFFIVFGDALADGDQAGNWLRLDVLANTESITGAVPMRDPITARNPYPAPGEAVDDRRGER